ncbi:MAG TPA: hypothetical protein VMA35_12170 [Candidatus Sulfopaludibacter sp.]|nr:hypothetical protein [Candidatus Sulfopaludibacter sp.]
MKFTLITSAALVILCIAHQGFSQGTLAPLYLSTNGDGTITPLQNGQLLEVGQDYEMTANPASGYVFSSWQPVNVFTSISIITNAGTVFGTTNMVYSPLPAYTYTTTLTFTMQPQMVIGGGDPILTESIGWQANFVAVPEPLDTMLIACGFLTVVVFRYFGSLGRIRVMSITRFALGMSLASFVFVTGCATSKPDSGQLDQLMRRTSALEQQVRDLEVANAELQKQVQKLQQQQPQTPIVPRWSPPQNPRVPPWGPPPTNPVPHLSPLETK